MRKILITILLLAAIAGAVSALPPLPAEFYGTVTIDSAPAPAGTVVAAYLGGTERGTLVISTAGNYGGTGPYDPRLIIQTKDEGDAGKPVVFRVNGINTSQTALLVPGTSTRLNLAALSGQTGGTTNKTPSAAENQHTISNTGLNLTDSGAGGMTATVNITMLTDNSNGRIDVNESSKTVTVQMDTFSVIVRSKGSIASDETNNTVTLDVDTIQLETNPLNAYISPAVGTVQTTINAELNGLPDSAGITTTITDKPSSDSVNTQFALVAAQNGNTIDSIAYSLVVNKTNLQNGRDIASATLEMTVAKTWVDEHGGKDAIRIYRRGDDGFTEMLVPVFTGYDSTGQMMVFTVISPRGLSEFSLSAVKSAGSSGGSGGSSSSGSSGSSGSGGSYSGGGGGGISVANGAGRSVAPSAPAQKPGNAQLAPFEEADGQSGLTDAGSGTTDGKTVSGSGAVTPSAETTKGPFSLPFPYILAATMGAVAIIGTAIWYYRKNS